MTAETFEEQVFLEIEQGNLRLRILNSPLGEKILYECQLWEMRDGRSALSTMVAHEILDSRQAFQLELEKLLARFERLNHAK